VERTVVVTGKVFKLTLNDHKRTAIVGDGRPLAGLTD
jgi:hypothetical protein